MNTARDARAKAEQLGGHCWVVKAQVHTRGRGRVGGIVVANSLDKVESTATELLGRRLITKQTGPNGRPIENLLIEKCIDISQELYLALLVDRSRERIVVIVSKSGGIPIEELAQKEPEKVHKITTDLVMGLQPSHCRRLAYEFGLTAEQMNQLRDIMMKLYQLFLETDLTVLEINPLAISDQGDLVAVDAKLDVDDNSLFRQTFLSEWRDYEQEDAREYQAQKIGFQYVSLKGNIGCIVNGAGLAMATTDLIKMHGAEPANFLDLGGVVEESVVQEAVHLLISDNQVKSILVNVFGGIVRCDVIASGILSAIVKYSIQLPWVMRFHGNGAEEAIAIIESSPYDIRIVSDLDEAAKTIIRTTSRL